jgi:hypothetical protein
VIAAVALTFPVWLHPTTQWIGGPGDEMKFIEFLGWYPFAITHGLNPLQNTYVNLPQGSNMMWDTTMPLAGIVLTPVTLILGAIAAYNVAMAGSLALDGWCTFLWLRRHVGNAAAAWIGGLLLVLGPFAAARAHEHLNLVMYFPIPFMLLAIEGAIANPTDRRLRRGVIIGLLAAVQLLLTEELLAIAVVAVGTDVILAALLFPKTARSRIVPLAKTLAVALVVFILICAVPVGYQFLGPGRIVGPIQPPNTFVTDLVNLVVPGDFAAWIPPDGASLAASWTGGGGGIEADAYIGIPLLVMAAYALIRWRKDRWLRVIGDGTAAAVIWSLGPYLHIDGVTDHLLPLPGRLLSVIPVTDNILPGRFDLFTDFGLAAIIAIFADRVVFRGRWTARAAGALGLALVCFTLAPQISISAYVPDTPRYFLAGGDVNRLPAGTVALVVPYGDSAVSIDPMLWQAEADFRFKMVSGAMYMGGPGGAPSFGNPNPTLGCAMRVLQLGGSASACGVTTVSAVRQQLTDLRVTVIIMGPMAYGTYPALQAPMEAFLSQVAGASPRHDQGALLWSYSG